MFPRGALIGGLWSRGPSLSLSPGGVRIVVQIRGKR